MKYSSLESRLRTFETGNDPVVLPGIFLVARLDGRNFTRLTREIHQFDAPFDARFRDMMAGTCSHLMNCGFNLVYAYTQSDEISVLFHPQDNTFGRRERKLNSVLAGEASAAFSLLLGAHAAFDCRLSQLPRALDVVDYFRWRQEDAHRNALSGHCYWMLRNDGESSTAATETLSGLNTSQKNELLFQRGINFNDLPLWQRRGIGLVWKTIERIGMDPRTGEQIPAERRQLEVIEQLPMKDEYDAFVGGVLTQVQEESA